MKKLVCFVLYLILSLGLNSVYAEENSDFNVYIKSGQYADGNYMLNYETVNSSSNPFSGTIVFGVFDSSGKLASVKSSPVELGSSEDMYNKISLDGAAEEFGTLKVFVWDSFFSMEPQITAVSVDFSEIPEPIDNEYYYFFEEPFITMGEVPGTVSVGGIVFNRPEDSREVIVNPGGYVELGGAGNMTKCSLGFKVRGDCTINVWARSRSSEQARTVKIGDASSELVYFDAPCDRINKGTYVHTGGEKELYVASQAAAVLIYAIEVIYEDSEVDNTNEWSVSDYSSLRKALWKANINGGTVVINADTISCNGPLLIENSSEEAVTLCSGEGYTALLDFGEYRDTVAETAISSAAAITIGGSNCTVRNIIIENAPHVGLRLNGGAGNNHIENVVSRYNGGSGFAMSNDVHDNTLKNCYAYRNCDIVTRGENADGFWVAFGAGTGNRLISCHAWENADDGFDSFRMFNEVYYENCAAWRNGVAEVHSGKYDFDRGRELDEKLPLVRRICEYDESFKEKYESGKFELPKGEFLLTTPISETAFTYISATDFVGSEWCGNGNGIKMGSGVTDETPQVGPEAVRIMKNCITFENPSKGFDRNNSACTVYVENGLSFDNGRNYWLDECTIEQFDNVLSGATDRNLFPYGMDATYLTATQLNRAKNYIGERIEILEDYLKNDEIPIGVCMERVFWLMW